MRPTQTSPWNALVENRVAIVIVFLLALAARAQTVFNPLYAIDTYSLAGKSVSEIGEQLLSQGRYGLMAVYGLRDLLGYQGFEVAVSANIFATLMISASGALLGSSIFARGQNWPIGLFAGIFALHPYGTEFFHFSEATFAIALSLLVASTGLHVALRGSGLLHAKIVPVLLMAFAISIYQTAAAVLVATCLMALVMRLVETDRFSWSSLLRSPASEALLLTTSSVVLYGIGFVASLAISGVTASSRADVSALLTTQGLFAKALISLKALRISLWSGFEILGPSAPVLLMALLIASACFILLRIRPQGATALAIVALLIAGAFIAAILPPTLSSDHWLVPRTLWAVVVPIAAVCSLGWFCAPRAGQQSIRVALGVLCLIYIGVSNRMIMDQRRVNDLDFQKANRIIARLEYLEDFGNIRSVAIVGGDWGKTSTSVGDMNISALFPAWSKIGLLREATGYTFKEPTPRQLTTAKAHCDTVRGWPNPDSVTILGSLGVVCMTRN